MTFGTCEASREPIAFAAMKTTTRKELLPEDGLSGHVTGSAAIRLLYLLDEIDWYISGIMGRLSGKFGL
jgi:hypothetical protein